MLRGHHQYRLGMQFEVGRDNYTQTNVLAGLSISVSGAGMLHQLPGVRAPDFHSRISCWIRRQLQ